jgi:hypothetical protein
MLNFSTTARVFLLRIIRSSRSTTSVWGVARARAHNIRPSLDQGVNLRLWYRQYLILGNSLTSSWSSLSKILLLSSACYRCFGVLKFTYTSCFQCVINLNLRPMLGLFHERLRIEIHWLPVDSQVLPMARKLLGRILLLTITLLLTCLANLIIINYWLFSHHSDWRFSRVVLRAQDALYHWRLIVHFF